MSLAALIRRAVPASLKSWVRSRSSSGRIGGALSPYLPATICVDVGASHYPHVKWAVFLNSRNTSWLAVEPNEANIGYTKNWRWPSRIATCTTGLSREGGQKTLYVTNVDTGSSLLPPVIPEGMTHRIRNLDYFFPVTERQIDTLTLVQALDGLPADAPVCVKLDTQGTELSILQGAQSLFDSHRIVGLETEATLLAQPLMQGSGKFWEVCRYLEEQGMELLHIKPISAAARNGAPARTFHTYLNECDAVFALRPDVAAKLQVEFRICLLAFYATNLFFEEALALLERDPEVCDHLRRQGCDLDLLQGMLVSAS